MLLLTSGEVQIIICGNFVPAYSRAVRTQSSNTTTACYLHPGVERSCLHSILLPELLTISNAGGKKDKTVEFTFQNRLNAHILLDIITIPELALLTGVYKMLEEHREGRKSIA